MKLETSQIFGSATYLLADNELAAIITQLDKAPTDQSPLQDVDCSNLAAKPPEEMSELAGAVEILLQPDKTVDLRIWPDGGDWLHYYGSGTSANLVMHSRNGKTGANLIIWPVTSGYIKAMAGAESLALSSIKTPQELKISVDFKDFLTVGTLIDRQQEIVLGSYAKRNAAPEIRFDIQALKAAYAKGHNSVDDPHWMISRLIWGLTDPLPDKLAVTEKQLGRLRDMRLLIEDIDGYAPLPSSELLFRQLADVEALFAIIITDHSNDQTTRRIYQTSQSQFWRYDFGEHLGAKTQVTLELVSSQELSKDLEVLASKAPVKAANTEQVEPEGMQACPSCGVEVLAGQSFCSGCGVNLQGVSETKTAIVACTKCGAPLEPGLKFCTQCGQPVGPQ